MFTYLDDNGNPVATPPAQKQYLDPNTGEPIAAPKAPMGFAEHLQKAVDLAATPQPGDKWSDNIGRGMVALAQPLVHPLQTIQRMSDNVTRPNMTEPIEQFVGQAKQMGTAPALERAVGTIGAGASLGASLTGGIQALR